MPALELTAAAIAREVAARLQSDAPRLREQWQSSRPVRHFIVDDVLPPDEVEEVFRNIPPRERLTHKKSLRESKWVGVDVDHYHPAIGAHLFAFQEPEVVRAVAAITGIDGMVADPSLYASGISLMAQDDFLNPHLDNSHDGDQRNYRVLNLLFYVTPGWTLHNGGNLELWTSALDQPLVVESRFNRLVVMATSDRSWHSVQPVVAEGARVCLSNYYFAPKPAADHEYRNVTSFRGRPEEPVKKVLLRADSAILNFVGKLMPSLLRRNPHRRQ